MVPRVLKKKNYYFFLEKQNDVSRDPESDSLIRFKGTNDYF